MRKCLRTSRKTWPRCQQRDRATLEYLIPRNVAIKARIVASDERESGLREILNFGHTFAHALESVTHYKRYQHGEAVAWGMMAAALLGREIGVTRTDDVCRIVTLVRRMGPLPPWPRVPANNLIAAMRSDKKTRDGKLRFVLTAAYRQGSIVRWRFLVGCRERRALCPRNSSVIPARRMAEPAATAKGTRPEGAQTEADASREVRAMFTEIAPRYDFLIICCPCNWIACGAPGLRGACGHHAATGCTRARSLLWGPVDLAFRAGAQRSSICGRSRLLARHAGSSKCEAGRYSQI